MQKLMIAIDMDSVTVDLMSSWKKYYLEKAGLPSDTDLEIIHRELEIDMPLLTKKEIYDFLDLPNSFYKSKPIPGAIRGINQLKKLGSIYFLTITKGHTAFDQKMKWIEKYIGKKYSYKLIGVSSGNIKNIVGDRFDIVIDDNPEYIENLEKAQGILFSMVQNAGYYHPNIIRAEDWKDVVKWVKRIKLEKSEQQSHMISVTQKM
jgi:5'(3')-deoxyribonucleotidase